MTDLTHDTLADLSRGTPALFTAAARGLPVLIGVQFLLAGQSLFGGLPWDLHGAVGGLVGGAVLLFGGYSVAVSRLRGFGWWAGVLLILYAVQLALAASGTAALAFHPFNGALLLSASLVCLYKVERRRAAHSGAA